MRRVDLNENSTIRQLHDAIKGIAQSAVKNGGQVEHAFTEPGVYFRTLLETLAGTTVLWPLPPGPLNLRHGRPVHDFHSRLLRLV